MTPKTLNCNCDLRVASRVVRVSNFSVFLGSEFSCLASNSICHFYSVREDFRVLEITHTGKPNLEAWSGTSDLQITGDRYSMSKMFGSNSSSFHHHYSQSSIAVEPWMASSYWWDEDSFEVLCGQTTSFFFVHVSASLTLLRLTQLTGYIWRIDSSM